MSETERVRALLVRHRRTVDHRVYRLLGPDPDHEDVVQDVFVRIAAKAATQRDPQRERSWVATVTVNVVRNHLRRRRVRRVVELHAQPPEAPHLLEPQLEARDLARRGYAVLDGIDPADRIALILRRIEGHAVDEVAAMCRCSRATAKRRVQRAEARLACLLDEHSELYAKLTRGGCP
ncbi:MAG: RNA polymerase sigma factor [Deltaproteobacteria bacterium]|nr:RNA polymerase sigma factor [Deltaproteobacteria bacterium]